ncbi:MAG: hypothetical protein KME38_01280 [Spirirestis rafaelensis WJT71-NPBG6]|jgi:hypothetical protein|nr:hypothetical protein [Spirirestis rafaelensis WJT71-NPBG6]
MFNSDDSAARILRMGCLYSGFQVDEVHTDYLKAKHKACLLLDSGVAVF